MLQHSNMESGINSFIYCRYSFVALFDTFIYSTISLPTGTAKRPHRRLPRYAHSKATGLNLIDPMSTAKAVRRALAASLATLACGVAGGAVSGHAQAAPMPNLPGAAASAAYRTAPNTPTRSAAAPSDTLTPDLLRSPQQIGAYMNARNRDTYLRTLAAYDAAQSAHPDDTALALARCRYIGMYSVSEADTVGDASASPGAAQAAISSAKPASAQAAAETWSACKSDLAQRFAHDPEVRLYLLETTYGAAAVAMGEPLLDRMQGWTPLQQARLHAALARAYSVLQRNDQAGTQALLAAQLDPGDMELPLAIRFLARTGRIAQATQLLAQAPLPNNAWIESQRLQAAVEVLPPAAVTAELRRAQAAKLTMYPWLLVRACHRGGDDACAAAALRKLPPTPNEQPDLRRLRFDVALATHDGAQAATVLRNWYDTAKFAPIVVRLYSVLLAEQTYAALADTMTPLIAYMLMVWLAIALLPGLIAFPAHYRGTVRQRIGRPNATLYEGIGLRHMWLALATMGLVLMALGNLLTARAALSLGDNLPISSADARMMVYSKLIEIGAGFLVLGYLLPRRRWRAWLGTGPWRPVLIVLLLYFLVSASLMYLLWRAHLHAPMPTAQTRGVAALVHAADGLGGLPAALLLFSVLVPLFEEFVFRGCILGGLSRHLSFGWANFWQAALFTLLHFDPPRIMFYMTLGLIAGWCARRTRGLGASVVLHGVNNAIFVLASLHGY